MTPVCREPLCRKCGKPKELYEPPSGAFWRCRDCDYRRVVARNRKERHKAAVAAGRKPGPRVIEPVQLDLLGRICACCGGAIDAAKRRDAIYCSSKCTRKAHQRRTTACARRAKQDRWNQVRREQRAGTYTPRAKKHKCEADRRLKRTYGIDLDNWQRIWGLQEGMCGICGTALEASPGMAAHTDHCHDSGEVRGILCRRCNNGMGFFDDDPELLLKAVEYLRASTLGAVTEAA